MKIKRSKMFTGLLIAFLMLGTIFISACSDTSDEGEPAPPPESSGEETNQPPESSEEETVFAGGWPYATTPTGHFNMFVPNAIELKFYRELHQLPLATYVAEDDEYVPMLAEGWELSEDNKKINIQLRDDVLWRSGENLMAKDVWTTFMIYRLVGNPVWNYVEEINIISDTSLEFILSEETTMIYRYILRKPIVDALTYGETAESLDALIKDGKDSTSTEWQNLANDFSNFRPDVINATGPYYLAPENVSQSHIELLKNESSFLADTVNFDKVLVYNGDVPDLTPLVLNKEVDYLTHQFPASSMQSFTDLGYETIQLQGVDGIAMYFNGAVKSLGEKEVRQAIAYVIDRNKIADLALPGVTRGTKYVSGLGDLMTETWVDTSMLTDYSVNLEKAKELLESKGMEQKDGTWYQADGSPYTLTIQSPSSWSDAATAASEIAQQLTAFGIKTTFEGIDPNSRQSNISEGNFELALSFFGTAQPHPMFAFETPLLLSNANVTAGLSYPMMQNTERYGEIDLEELIYASTKGWDTEKQKEIVEQIVVTVNDTVPYLPLYSKWSKNLSSKGMRTDWGSNESLYLNSAGDDNFAVLKILSGELKPIK